MNWGVKLKTDYHLLKTNRLFTENTKKKETTTKMKGEMKVKQTGEYLGQDKFRRLSTIEFDFLKYWQTQLVLLSVFFPNSSN